MSQRESFNDIAKIYDEVRPTYPEALIQDVITQAELTSKCRLLEIGAGTGKATLPFAEKGFHVHCIEPAQNMTELLIQKCSGYTGITAEITTFEEWEPEESIKYDLIYCAQAFHWIDSKIKYKKCHHLLKDGGYLAVFMYQPSGEAPEMMAGINQVITKYSPDFFKTDSENTADSSSGKLESEMVESGLFEYPEIKQYQSTLTQTAEAYVKAMNSWSRYAVLNHEIKKKINDGILKVIHDNDGEIHIKFTYSLYLAKRKS